MYGSNGNQPRQVSHMGYGPPSPQTSEFRRQPQFPVAIGSGAHNITQLQLATEDGYTQSRRPYVSPAPIGAHYMEPQQQQHSDFVDVDLSSNKQESILPQTTKDVAVRRYSLPRWSCPSATPFFTTLAIGLLLFNTLCLLYVLTNYVSHTDMEEYQQNLHKPTMITATPASVIIPHAVRSSNVGAGEAFHDHVYSTYHYEFILDNRVGSWIRYPNRGSLEDIDMDRMMSFTLCCHGPGGKFLCKGKGELEAEMHREFDSKEVYLSVLIRDSALESRACILTYTMDQYQDV